MYKPYYEFLWTIYAAINVSIMSGCDEDLKYDTVEHSGRRTM